jgi:ketosteroid isomerase-like protein
VKAIAVLFLLACGSATSSVRTFTPVDKTSIIGVLDAQAAAWNKGDLAGYMDGYAKSDDLVFTSGGNVRKGWQATFDTFQNKYAQDKSKMGALKFEVLGVQPLGADGAVVLGKWFLTGSPADGSGVFSVVLERRPEGWRVIHDHTSSAPSNAP